MAAGPPAHHPDMIEFRGELNLINQRLDSNVQALNASISAMGAEVHLLRGLLESGQALLMEKMQEVGSTSVQLRLLTESIREHNALEKSRQETTERHIGELKDKEAHARGERRGAAFVLSLLVCLIGYVYVADKDRAEKKDETQDLAIAQNKALIIAHDTKLDAVQKKLGP